jgi:ribosomal protein RSM22 (predicted rRNA methylase)
MFIKIKRKKRRGSMMATIESPERTKVKVKPSRNTHMDAQGERRYSSYLFSTSALDGGEWSASGPDRVLDPGKGPPVPIV